MDILDPLSEIFDGKETVTKDYHKPHPVDENILPKVEKNEELQNNKILFSDNDTSDYIKSEQVSVVNEETTWSVMDVLVPLSNIFDDRKTVTEDNNKHNSIPFEEESGSLNDTVVEMKLQKRNLKHRSPEDDEHSVLRLKESNKMTIKKPRRNLRKYDLTLYEGGLNECNQCKYKTPRKGDLKKHIQSKHEGVRYSCNKCEYKATQRGSLKINIEAKHEEPHYSCDQCEYKVQ